MLLASRTHTVGDVRRWIIDYDKWMDNTAEIQTAEVTSSSTTCTITGKQALGREVQFFLNGGVEGETFMVSIQIIDSIGNTKHDHMQFTVIAP